MFSLPKKKEGRYVEYGVIFPKVVKACAHRRPCGEGTAAGWMVGDWLGSERQL